MSSLKARIEQLEADLRATPMRITAYHDLPFAILRYDPEEEWPLRREARPLATRLNNAGKQVHTISLADILWDTIERAEGLDAIVEVERTRGFEAAEAQVTTYLTDPDWYPLTDLIAKRLSALDPDRDIAFLLRAASMSPDIYHMSSLLDQMHGRTSVPTILFYPGTMEGLTGLRYMGLAHRETTGNYRVKIYG